MSNLNIIGYILLILTYICVGWYWYRIGYIDGKREVIMRDELLKDLNEVVSDIRLEIERRAQYPNIGKMGCIKRINKLIEKYDTPKKAGLV